MKYNKVISQHLSTISLFLILEEALSQKLNGKKVINDETFMKKVIESRIAQIVRMLYLIALELT